jgi:hypothetical protein
MVLSIPFTGFRKKPAAGFCLDVIYFQLAGGFTPGDQFSLLLIFLPISIAATFFISWLVSCTVSISFTKIATHLLFRMYLTVTDTRNFLRLKY